MPNCWSRERSGIWLHSVNAFEAAKDLLERGWAPIPVPAGSKNPGARGWQKRRFKQAAALDKMVLQAKALQDIAYQMRTKQNQEFLALDWSYSWFRYTKAYAMLNFDLMSRTLHEALIGTRLYFSAAVLLSKTSAYRGVNTRSTG